MIYTMTIVNIQKADFGDEFISMDEKTLEALTDEKKY